MKTHETKSHGRFYSRLFYKWCATMTIAASSVVVCAAESHDAGNDTNKKQAENAQAEQVDRSAQAGRYPMSSSGEAGGSYQRSGTGLSSATTTGDTRGRETDSGENAGTGR